MDGLLSMSGVTWFRWFSPRWVNESAAGDDSQPIGRLNYLVTVLTAIYTSALIGCVPSIHSMRLKSIDWGVSDPIITGSVDTVCAGPRAVSDAHGQTCSRFDVAFVSVYDSWGGGGRTDRLCMWNDAIRDRYWGAKWIKHLYKCYYA